jgi:hypothetical protein
MAFLSYYPKRMIRRMQGYFAAKILALGQVRRCALQGFADDSCPSPIGIDFVERVVVNKGVKVLLLVKVERVLAVNEQIEAKLINGVSVWPFSPTRCGSVGTGPRTGREH